MKVFVDPACNINYGSFYIKGLWDVFGRNNVMFNSKYFKNLYYTSQTHCMAFVVNETRYVIDWADSNAVFYDNFLQWADIYGKVNYNKDCIEYGWRDKVKPVSPNFGIGCFGKDKWEATMLCLKNYLKCFSRIQHGLQSYLSPYLWLYKRSRIILNRSDSTVGSKTIFMVSRYWNGENLANNARISFIRACHRLQSEGVINFIGGMVPDMENSDCPSDVIIRNEIPMQEYVRLLERSLLVFNTPAVHVCHGWKLPEYMAHGKIILSTPFVNELPVGMIHGKNIFFSNADELSLYEAIKTIVNNRQLQATLEEGSRRYWDEYASPKACINHFIYG